ncbi:DUF547 domain-containing protein [Psychroserpens sp. SPM9]|uniref:DUF547 domain-containing protein n=1 Tax=Psychroserpens sp. SPM9 TaxID=2975598 RepID=UPI0021A74858|nr:DUF547 domain-containing protein [Psychroserpens sp. SPM9]MDG5490251.1 DUF547 domain-containing protein [Psychroserpens sp. SPM9]
MKYLLVVLLSVSAYSCFSAKGLPIKEVKAPTTTNINSTSNTSTTEALLDHSSWDALLKKYVAKNGDVDYKGFKSDAQKLDEYINYLASKVPEKNWNLNEQLAYFINVYNANTIKLIIDNYPTKSIKDIGNPWMKNRLKIGDEDYSLADIENGILRKMNEPRIHFAINCASYSCPKLLNTAYTADNVQELMERATKEFINNSEKNKLSATQLKLSEIFKWYKSDFTENGSLIDYINQYAETKISADAKIDYIDYDWNLNEQN